MLEIVVREYWVVVAFGVPSLNRVRSWTYLHKADAERQQRALETNREPDVIYLLMEGKEWYDVNQRNHALSALVGVDG